jgi:hypothetical protein
MRDRWLCFVFAAMFAVVPGEHRATAQEVQAAEVLLAVIGESPVVMRALEAELGAAAAGVLAGKSAAEVGKLAVSNDQVVSTVALGLPTKDKLEWAGAVNTLRLSDTLGLVGSDARPAINNNLFTFRHAWINPEPTTPNEEDFHDLLQHSREISRTISITPLGDVKLNPKLEVPFMTFGKTRFQTEVESIPAGKVALAGGTAAAAVTCGQECIDKVRQQWKQLLGEDSDIPQ